MTSTAASNCELSVEPLSGTANESRESLANQLNAKVVLLTHYIPLYQVRPFQEVTRRVRDAVVLLSTVIEPNRKFQPDWSGLNVVVQKAMTIRRKWKHSVGFEDELYIHFPYDTFRQLHLQRPDVVVSFELGFRSFMAALYRRTHRRSKLVLATFMSEHTEQGRGWVRMLLRRWLIRQADVITYNGPSCESYLKGIGVPASKLMPFPYVADDRTIYRGAVKRGEANVRKLVYVGQLIERKGIVPCLNQLADYARQHPDQQIQVQWIGDGPMAPAIRDFPTPENLSFEMLGNVPATLLGETMSQAGALLLPSLADEWALVVNEALHAGMPVIGSCLAQATETLVRDGFNGWTYDPRDPASLTKALDQYFSSTDSQLDAMRMQCRESVKERTPVWAAEQLMAAIRRVFDRS